MSFLIVRPASAPEAYRIAAETFADLCKAVTGTRPGIVTDEAARSALPGDPSLSFALIGNDDVNCLTAALLSERGENGLPIRIGTDDYCVRSSSLCGVPVLVLAGGRGRSAIYAVYRYFEKIVGCRWFWDGDRIPKRNALPLEQIDFTEQSRFSYRGTRYFAHRGLHRFQAEHWSAEDWKKEIDWLLKKRLNLFLLRIGIDDLFQKAFPDAVDYPDKDEKLAEAGDGFDDRSLFWDLRFRGELRKTILSYARDRDLMHPEDCGTMTHWYSRTPKQFLEKMRPSLLSQPDGTNYAEATGLVWDIREKRNLDLYFHLTETHIREYGDPGLFHTIGLAERAFSADRNENLRLKLLTYRLLCRRLREEYPRSKLLLASWDLWMFYSPDEVRELLRTLDPEQAILLDYTSDSARESNFTAWNVEGNFPWIFGIFHAYEPSNEIRGNYPVLSERLARIKHDPMCKGMVFWPELSHGDPFMTEFFASNAWELSDAPLERQLSDFCASRYPEKDARAMFSLWQTVLRLAPLNSWSKYERVTPWAETDVFCRAPYVLRFDGEAEPLYDEYLRPLSELLPELPAALRGLLPYLESEDDFTRRDAFDLARTLLSRVLNGCLLSIENGYAAVRDGKAEQDRVRTLMKQTLALCEQYARLLESHPDYSLAETLDGLRAVAPVGKHFPETLKKNCDNLYCRSNIAECARELYLPELQRLFACVEASLRPGEKCRPDGWDALLSFCEQNRLAFEKAPLSPFVCRNDLAATLRSAADTVEILLL